MRSHIAFRLLEGRIPHPTPYGSDFSAIQVRGKVVRNHRRKSDTEEFAARCRESYFCDRFSHAWNRALNHDSGFGFAGLLLPVRTRRAVDAKARGGRCNRASKRGGQRQCLIDQADERNQEMTAVPKLPPAPVGQQGPPARAAASDSGGHSASRAGPSC